MYGDIFKTKFGQELLVWDMHGELARVPMLDKPNRWIIQNYGPTCILSVWFNDADARTDPPSFQTVFSKRG